MNKEPTYITLDNGLRIVCITAATPVEYFGVTVNSGSRDEQPGFHGLAHFVEHTIFKGTSHRKSYHIINRMESVGGELNAFTTKEETTIYSIAPKGNLARAAELVSDLVRNSVFPEKEIERERDVVRDEIDCYLDSPADAVYDDFEDLIFAGSQLGHNILGNREDLDRFSPPVCREYLRGNFTASRMVVFYFGPASAERVRNAVERNFSAILTEVNPLARKAPVPVAPFRKEKQIDSHQAHTVIGAQIPGMFEVDRFTLGLATNILGGPGMNSRLNVALRERRGLVYVVDASTSLLSDCGLFTIYYGCDPADNGRCRDLVERELKRLSTEALTPRALAAAKSQYLGQLTVASGNHDQSALSAACTTLFMNRIPTVEEETARINAITPESLLETAAMLSPERMSVLTLV